MSKVIIITGTSTGIGFALAEYFGKKGDKVYGLSRKNVGNQYFTTIPTDITDNSQVLNAVEQIFTKENKIVLIEQYRKPLEKSIIEIPAGKVEKGEQPELTAIRELEEETGYTASKLSFITSFYTSPGFADELMQIFITDELIPLETPAAKG